MTDRGTNQTLTVTFRSVPGGPLVDPTAVNLTLTRDGTTVAGPFTGGQLHHDGVGTYRYEWAIPADLPLGSYLATWSGVLPGQSTPSVGYERVTVTASPLVDPALCWPVTYPAGASTSFDPATDDYDDDRATTATLLAVGALRTLTLGLVGGCPTTIHPCGPACGPQTWRTYPVMGPQPGWGPRLDSGTWINVRDCTHGSSSCGCRRGGLELPGPVGEVTEVRTSAGVLDPAAYELRGCWLYRLDGQTWPYADENFTVTYLRAAVVDALGAAAAGLLAAEFYTALGSSTSKCKLPARTTQIVRQGVALTVRTDALFPDGLTGIAAVDVFVETYNPNHLKTAPAVYSPDLMDRSSW